MLLYFGEEIKRRLYMRAIPSEETVLGYYDHACPRCGERSSPRTRCRSRSKGGGGPYVA